MCCVYFNKLIQTVSTNIENYILRYEILAIRIETEISVAFKCIYILGRIIPIRPYHSNVRVKKIMVNLRTDGQDSIYRNI